MKINNKIWALDDDIVEVHHHSGDDLRNYLVDETTGEEVSSQEASYRAEKNLREKYGFNTSRRTLLKGSLGAAALLVVENTAPRLAFAADGTNNGVVVSVFLRGGMDGLNVLSPYDDSTLTKIRTTTFNTPDTGFEILPGWALHPKMKPLLKAWNNGHLSFSHGVGTSDMGRSHFAESDNVEKGSPMNVGYGWLGRYLMAENQTNDTFRAVSVSGAQIKSTDSIVPVLTSDNYSNYKIENDSTKILEATLTKLYNSAGGPLQNRSKNLFASMKEVQSLGNSSYTPSNGATYTNTEFGKGLKQIAQTIKAGKGLKVAAIDCGPSWDTHVKQSNAMNSLVDNFAQNMAAFYDDLGSLMNNVTVFCQSEFGRTSRENYLSGCDHGKGNLVIVMSGKAKPKALVGDWYGLGKDVTDPQGDVEVLTEHRDLSAEILAKTLNASPAVIAQVFPNYTPKTKGILR